MKRDLEVGLWGFGMVGCVVFIALLVAGMVHTHRYPFAVFALMALLVVAAIEAGKYLLAALRSPQ